MEVTNRTGYVEFSTKICDVDTDIRILETLTHVFIYINQDEEKVNLYDEDLKKYLTQKNLKRNKKMVVFCNLKNQESLKKVGELVYDVFTK